jgi:hypothetical protein
MQIEATIFIRLKESTRDRSGALRELRLAAELATESSPHILRASVTPTPDPSEVQLNLDLVSPSWRVVDRIVDTFISKMVQNFKTQCGYTTSPVSVLDSLLVSA